MSSTTIRPKETISVRCSVLEGIDNAYYYRLTDDKRYYMDYTGTGNSLNMRNPHVLQLIMDSLRYWILEMHVDGFRFDLAAALACELHDVDRLSAFFDLVQQDPVISQVKLIAEPWDVGEGGYQVGNFPAVWSEWNGKYRDCVRDFWRGEDQLLGEFASRFTGSSDLYESTTRLPYASINFITAHDGFTLNDLVSYNDKHNEANGEDNKDGENHNRSWNCGVEGADRQPGSDCTCGPAKSETSWRRCSCRKAYPCCWAAMKWGARNRETTMPTARTTRFPGTTGKRLMQISWLFRKNSSRSGKITRSCAAVAGFKACPSMAARSRTLRGLPWKVSRWTRRTGDRGMPSRWGSF